MEYKKKNFESFVNFMENRYSFALVNICVDLQKMKKNVKFLDKNDKFRDFKKKWFNKVSMWKKQKNKIFKFLW